MIETRSSHTSYVPINGSILSEYGRTVFVPEQPPNSYIHVVRELGNFPDPSVVLHNGQYVGFATTSDGLNIQRSVSEDGLSWRKKTDALPTLPDYVQQGCTWAPEIFYHDRHNLWYLFYAHRMKHDGAMYRFGGFGISAAVSDSLESPFTPIGEAPIIYNHLLPPDHSVHIDPYVYRHADGYLRMVWGSARYPIMEALLHEDCTSLIHYGEETTGHPVGFAHRRMRSTHAPWVRSMIPVVEDDLYRKVLEGICRIPLTEEVRHRYGLAVTEDEDVWMVSGFDCFANGPSVEDPADRYGGYGISMVIVNRITGEVRWPERWILLEGDAHYKNFGHNSLVASPKGLLELFGHVIDRADQYLDEERHNLRYMVRVVLHPHQDGLPYIPGGTHTRLSLPPGVLYR